MKPINPHDLAKHIGQGLIDGLTAQQQKRKKRALERMHSMKLSEFIDKYGDQKIDEKDLKETLNIKAKAWMPETGERYYYINLSGISRTDVYYDSCDYSKSIVEHNRVFQTREETEFEAERQKFMRYMEREFARNSDPIDWEDENQHKWFLSLSWDERETGICNCYVYRAQGTLYTTNSEWLLEFEEEHKADIKRYCFGVEK